MKTKILCALAALLCTATFAADPPKPIPLSQAARIANLEARVTALEAKLKPQPPVRRTARTNAPAAKPMPR